MTEPVDLLLGEMPAVRTNVIMFDLRVLVLMMAVEEQEKVTVTDLCERLSVGYGTLGDWLKLAEKAQVIERFKDHVNHRKTWVRLTIRGKRERLRTRKNKGGPNG